MTYKQVQDEEMKETMVEFDIKQRLFLAGKYHSTRFNQWFEQKFLSAMQRSALAVLGMVRERMPKCEDCGGVGYTAEHDSPSRHGEDGECINCPIQVQCEKCYGGMISGSTLTKSLDEIEKELTAKE